MKIGFITTLNTNIGDDFIRTGIENIIFSLLDKERLQFTYVNKHQPETALSTRSPSILLNKLPDFKGKGRLKRILEKYYNKKFSVYSKQNLIIQSGAPFLWPNCYMNEWAEPIWYNAIGQLKEEIPTLNLAIGSCYPWENQSEVFQNKKDEKYAQDIGSFCRITTTRDRLASKLLHSVGVDNKLMPCTAFFVDNTYVNNEKGKYVLINYMEGGGILIGSKTLTKKNGN